jgi:hypothetical protein
MIKLTEREISHQWRAEVLDDKLSRDVDERFNSIRLMFFMWSGFVIAKGRPDMATRGHFDKWGDPARYKQTLVLKDNGGSM